MTLALIMSSLASQSVNVGGVAPRVYNGATLPNKIETTSLPARLLLAGNEEGRGASGQFVAIGKLDRVVFQISDLMLAAPTAQGLGRPQYEPVLKTYVDDYLAMLRNWRDAGQSNPAQAVLQDFSLTISTIGYPAAVSERYWSVACVVTVAEWYSGA